MPEDTLIVRTDPTNSFDVLQRLGQGADRLGASGERIGAGFLRGDRVVRTATQNITQGLFNVNNAADTALITLQSLERVFRIPIGLTIFAAGAIAAGAAIVAMIEKASKAREELFKITQFSVRAGNPDFLGTDQISSNLDEIKKKIEEISGQEITRSHSLLSTLLGTGGVGPLAGIIPAQNAADQEKIAQLQKAAVRDVDDLTSKQNDLNRIEKERLDGEEELADLDKLETDHKERLGKLAQGLVAAGLAQTEAARQLLEVENDRFRIADATLRKKQEEVKLKESIKTAQAITGFFADVGSGRFVSNFAAEQKKEADAERGRQQIEEFRRARDAGITLGPIASAELRDADRLAKQEKTGLPALLNADFTNLLDLSRYDFTGLLPLSGLTISIQ